MTASFPPRVHSIRLYHSIRLSGVLVSQTPGLLTLSLLSLHTHHTHLIPLSPSSTFYGASGVGEPLEKISLAMISRWIWDVPS